MSDGRPKKRDWLFKKLRRPEPPAEKKTGLHHSPATGESSTHTPTTVLAGMNETTTPSTTTPSSSTRHPITPGPTCATAAATDAAHTLVGNEGEQPISTAACSIQAQSLWSRAINSDELSSQERKTLADVGFGVDSREMASAVRSMTEEILNEGKGELWKVKFGEEDSEVALRDVGMKILRWVDKFKQIGDIIVQFDPAHAALPWAGFRFLLQVDLNR